MRLTLLPGELAIARLAPQAETPLWAKGGPLVAVIRTPHELSVVCPTRHLPTEVPASRGWRALEVQGPLSFDLVGVLASLLEPLARAGVSVFVLSTYDTDYILVQQGNVEKALRALQAAGHEVIVGGQPWMFP